MRLQNLNRLLGAHVQLPVQHCPVHTWWGRRHQRHWHRRGLRIMDYFYMLSLPAKSFMEQDWIRISQGPCIRIYYTNMTHEKKGGRGGFHVGTYVLRALFLLWRVGGCTWSFELPSPSSFVQKEKNSFSSWEFCSAFAFWVSFLPIFLLSLKNWKTLDRIHNMDNIYLKRTSVSVPIPCNWCWFQILILA